MKRQKATIDLLLKKARSYLPVESDFSLVEKSYKLVSELHFGEKRLSGDDYVDHLLETAYILAEINADLSTLCAGLLHDMLECNLMTYEELEESFGSEIASLVKGVTTINKLNVEGDNEAVIANHRKILVGISEDVRVIIVKLADRLHNMRTLFAIPLNKQKEKAKETIDILIPIAHRLGMSSIKSELEDLSLRYYKPEVYFDIVEKLNATKLQRDNSVKEMCEVITNILTSHNIKHKIKGRSKSIYSIYKKMAKGKKFSEIYDLYAMRVFVDSEQDCYQVLGIIHSKFKPMPKRFKDYVAMPKTNMYQSLHTTVFGSDSHLFEIQIRTYEMDKIAENGIASHWSYKEKGSVTANLQNAMEQKLNLFKSVMELKDQNDSELLDSMKESILKESIYVFTPKGDVIELSQGSTPIDFAYRVHSSVGDTMIGAIVNDCIVSLDYELKDNDIIRINTNKNSTPSREWINMAKSSQTKNKIKSYFNKIDKEEYNKIGLDLIQKEVKKRKISYSDFFTNENVDKILTETKCKSLEELYINVGNNKLSTNAIVNIIDKVTDTKEELILKKIDNTTFKETIVKDDIIVLGIDNIKINVASCCKPIPGDKIIGYITKGNGITVHRMSCPNVDDLDNRFIDVYWNEVTTKKYPTQILVHSQDSKNILLDIIAKTSKSDVTIVSINTINTNDNYMYEITVSVSNKELLEKFMLDLKNIKSIIDVNRVIK
ncbi:MAG: bifunctional (p)ppGpp synthetase/guanosine-3',5'-bis(diphosphate) 3'-pyrophosphohydrolase [Mycoplasmatota bacterium]